jgi:hypothetical protein
MSVSHGSREHTQPAVSLNADERDTLPASQSVSDPDLEVLAGQDVSSRHPGHIGTHTGVALPQRVPDRGG